MNPKKNDAGDRASGLREALADLENPSETLPDRSLAIFSDLNPDELERFDGVFRRLDARRRQALLSGLKELAEDNVEFNFSVLFKHALGDADEVVRREAIDGLWEEEEPSLIRPLLNMLEKDSSSNVREAAATALGRFAILAECRKVDETNISRLSQPLLAIFKNAREPLPIRSRALEAVAPLSLGEVTRAIWAAYRQEETEMKASAIKAMGLNCDLLWLPTIIRELSSDNPEIRYEAAKSAGALGEVEASPALIELLTDTDPEVRLAAVQALGDIGGAEAKRALRHTLRHKEQAMRDAAATALSKIEVFEEPLSTKEPGS